MKQASVAEITEIIWTKAHDTHNATRFRCDITAISHPIQVDTLHMNLWWKSQAQMKMLCIYVEKQFTCFLCTKNPLYICGEKFLCQKLFVYRVHTADEFTTKMGKTLIDLVCQYPVLWDKQDAKYNDSNYKEAKWKEITEILCLNKDDVIKKWKIFEGHFCRQSNIKSKSGDGLSQCKPKWMYYDIMSLIDIILLKWRYVPIYLITSYIQHTYKQQTITYDFDQINSGKIVQNVNGCFNILVLHLMFLMIGMKIKVMMMKGRNNLLLTHKTPRWLIKWKTLSHLHPATGLQYHHP